MRLKNLAILSFVLSIVIVSAVSAEIIINQPRSLYNLGDKLSVEVKVDSIKPGYIDINLVCSEGNEEVNIYHNIFDTKTISIKRELTPLYIGNVSGNCYLKASYGGETTNSQNFEISKYIEVTPEISKINYEIGKSVKIKGIAIKKNNQLVGQIQSAFVDATLKDKENIKSSNIAKDGQFEVSFSVPETTHSGKYIILIRVHDEDEQGNELNVGEATAELNVIQKPAKLEIATDKENLMPGETIQIIPLIYDFAGDSMSDKVLMKIEDSNSKVLYEGFVNSEENFSFKAETTSPPGYLKIKTQKDNLSSEKSVEVLELKKIEARIENETLIIENAGNVPYKGIVEIKIGDESFFKEIELEVGEKKKYELSAPDGKYNINVKSDSLNFSRAGVPITGGAIGVREINKGLNNIFYEYPVVWVFIFVVLAILLFTWYKKREREKRISAIEKEQEVKARETSRKGGVEIIDQRAIIEKIRMGEIRRAEQVLVLQGKKQPASIIAIKIKNDIEGIAKQNLTNALEYAYKRKAVSSTSGPVILLIFSPLITKTFKNEESAVRTALDIERALNEHNKRFRNKIEFGIGVNSGDIINKIEDNTLKFTSIGKTIGTAKKIAEISENEVLLSKEVHEKTMNSVKAEKNEKAASSGIETFRVKRIVNTEESKKFIQDFLRRNA